MRNEPSFLRWKCILWYFARPPVQTGSCKNTQRRGFSSQDSYRIVVGGEDEYGRLMCWTTARIKKLVRNQVRTSYLDNNVFVLAFGRRVTRKKYDSIDNRRRRTDYIRTAYCSPVLSHRIEPNQRVYPHLHPTQRQRWSSWDSVMSSLMQRCYEKKGWEIEGSGQRSSDISCISQPTILDSRWFLNVSIS
jgi:hypothetical protein